MKNETLRGVYPACGGTQDDRGRAQSLVMPEIQKDSGKMSPVIFRSGPYRFYFVSHDLHEPPHVHIDRDAFSTKFWLKPVALAYNLGFPARELRTLEALTSEHQKELLEAWNEYFGT